MALRCLLFSSDEEASQPVCQILAELGIEAEHCSEAVHAVDQVSKQSYQLVIVDWENQPEATLLLNAARERKASERPLALAIVANDASVPQSLQAGANSVLRKPIQEAQARDTLTTAQGLIRTKMAPRPLAQAAAAASGPAPDRSSDSLPAAGEKSLRAGEFLQSAPSPSTQFVTESELPKTFEEEQNTEVDPLADLEPMAAAVESQPPAEEHPPALPDEPRGLSWYLKAKGISAAAAPAPAPEPPPAKPELLSLSDTVPQAPAAPTQVEKKPAPEHAEHEQKSEEALFAYISGEGSPSAEAKPQRRIGKLPVLAATAAILAAAYFAVPQSLWKPKAQTWIASGARALHNWLNPQPKVTAPAPRTYESFARPGDEYKLPTAEPIPDATTDPSQIRVVPVVDPTAKHPNGTNATQDPAAVDTSPKDNPEATPAGTGEAPQGQVPATGTTATPQPGESSPPPASLPAATETQQPQVSNPPSAPVHQEQPVSSPVVTPVNTPPQVTPAPRPAPAGNIPSSLRSQMASMTPEASGNKPVEAALPSIEPVELSEAAARSLLVDQTPPTYPDSAKGQQGTVVLQLLIGRDGSVQDAKFMQGSLAFARAASDAVRQWHFKPYLLNARPVSVRTVLTLHFKPGA